MGSCLSLQRKSVDETPLITPNSSVSIKYSQPSVTSLNYCYVLVTGYIRTSNIKIPHKVIDVLLDYYSTMYWMDSIDTLDTFDMDDAPFIHRRTSTQTSSLSAVAVNLSFPSTMIHPHTQLSPIGETTARNYSAMQWGQVIDDEYKGNTHQDVATFELVGRFENNQSDESGDSITSNNSDSICSVSYMTDNTMMLQDINNQNYNMYDIEIISAEQCSQISVTDLNGCDIVRSPINIFRINDSVEINNKEEKQ